jgi:hypothetical protein
MEKYLILCFKLNKMEEILKKNGWSLYSSCSCGGTLEKRFNNRRFEGIWIHIRPNQKKWFVKRNNRDIGQGNPSDFNTKMAEYGYVKENSGVADASGVSDVEAQPQA